ncbi:MAG: hypothetical protein M3Q60_14275 [Actinomycetota bacterium]|nr:hypothetical protein [Actinomycetota bacterium]
MPPASATALPFTAPSTKSLTLAPASVWPAKVVVESLVRLSELEEPLSLAASRSMPGALEIGVRERGGRGQHAQEDRTEQEPQPGGRDIGLPPLTHS